MNVDLAFNILSEALRVVRRMVPDNRIEAFGVERDFDPETGEEHVMIYIKLDMPYENVSKIWEVVSKEVYHPYPYFIVLDTDTV